MNVTFKIPTAEDLIKAAKNARGEEKKFSDFIQKYCLQKLQQDLNDRLEEVVQQLIAEEKACRESFYAGWMAAQKTA